MSNTASTKMFRMKSLTETDWETDEPLYWSNDLGWVDRESATVFTAEEIVYARLIGYWVSEEVFFLTHAKNSDTRNT